MARPALGKAEGGCAGGGGVGVLEPAAVLEPVAEGALHQPDQLLQPRLTFQEGWPLGNAVFGPHNI